MNNTETSPNTINEEQSIDISNVEAVSNESIKKSPINLNPVEEIYMEMSKLHNGTEDIVELMHNDRDNKESNDVDFHSYDFTDDEISNVYKVSEDLATDIGADKHEETNIAEVTYKEISSYHEGTGEIDKYISCGVYKNDDNKTE